MDVLVAWMVNLGELELGSIYRKLLLPLRYSGYSVQSFWLLIAISAILANFL